ncbi:Necrosis inducing protein NPP1 [Phytophthora megakarya]|uniref:Necrosis inducing protein NPP1 n=1 Tax=Phytophthora megakarya TaxID=4795 RepID=A0A225WBN3_9STRA|nr:Necrosis inducing protein NPP1 [Phytophthora megakarya]
MAPNVSDGPMCGPKSILTRWMIFTLCFDDIHVELQCLENGPVQNTVIATATTSFTISMDSLRLVFPHLIKEGEHDIRVRALADKLLGQRFVVRSTVVFEWDNSIDRITKMQSQSDLLTPMLRVFGNLEEETTTGSRDDESRITTRRTTSNNDNIHSEIERYHAEKEDNTNNTNDEQRAFLLFRKNPVVSKTLQKRPAAAKVIQDNPAIAKIIKTNPGIMKTVGKMQKDKKFANEVQSSPVYNKLQSSLKKSPSKKFTVDGVKNMGAAMSKSMASTEKWHDDPLKVIALGLFAVFASVQAQNSQVSQDVIESGVSSQVHRLIPTRNTTRGLAEYPSSWVTKSIDHDQVKPFAQPEPITISDKVGVKFKPQIHIKTGCEPYPAVNDVGETSGGLKPTGNIRGKCGGSGLGSQVYGRGKWHNDVWAIMYAWYFPKASPSAGLGFRHQWQYAVIFIDNPDVPEPKVLGCSMTSYKAKAKKYKPCPSFAFDGTSIKFRYKHQWPEVQDLDVTSDAGKFQDLIMWDQLTEDARQALNSRSCFGDEIPPMNDWLFATHRKYRKQERDYVHKLECGVRKIHEEIKLLEQQLEYASIGISRSQTLWGAATDYFRLFRHGIRSPSDTSYSCALNVLDSSMAPNVRDGLMCGPKAILTRWMLFSLCFDDILVDLQCLKKGPIKNSVVATVITNITISTGSLRLVFPHLIKEGERDGDVTSLADKLLGQHLVVRGSVVFEWDSSIGRVTKMQSQADMLTPMLRVLGTLEDVNRVFERSSVTPECCWPQFLE